MIELLSAVKFSGTPTNSLIIGIEFFIAFVSIYLHFVLSIFKKSSVENYNYINKEMLKYGPSLLTPILINYFIPNLFFILITVPYILLMYFWVLKPFFQKTKDLSFYLNYNLIQSYSAFYWICTLINVFLRFL